LEEDQMGSARRLCALVDCLPLGIELVARHLRFLEVHEVAERVEADLRRWAGMPAGGRTGLWAALDASVEPLGVSELDVLMAMAVMGPDADLGLIGEVAGWPGAEDDLFDTVARLVDASLVQVRSGVGAARYELLRSVAVHTLERADPAWLADARHRYERAVMSAAATLARQLTSADRSSVLRRLDREMPHVRNVLGPLGVPPVDPALAARGLELAVALGDYWLGRHPAEGLKWIDGLLTAANPGPPQRAEAQLRRSHLAYWLTEFSIGAAIAEEARDLFAGLGDPLGEGRALRRLGAISAATDDMVAARRWLEASLGRLEEAGVQPDIGTTLLHLGSLLADEGDVEAARPALARALAIATAGGDPLARAHALAALNLAHWKAGDLPAALSVGSEALNLFRELGHRPTEGTVAYRLAAVARGLGRPKAARRYALLARAAGEQSSTRSTVAMAEINLARLDLDDQAWSTAAEHLGDALAVIDPEADRWVLVEALEAVARLAVGRGRSEAAPLLDRSARIRREIHQPVAPTEAADLAAAVARSGGYTAELASPEAAVAYQTALTVARQLATPVPLLPFQRRRPRP
jgi:tetratricopeptide (TPR) repeat protein